MNTTKRHNTTIFQNEPKKYIEEKESALTGMALTNFKYV